MSPRHAQTTQTTATASYYIGRPVPAHRNIPYCQTCICNDGHHPSKYDGRPSRSTKDAIRGPSVRQRTDNLHGICRCWVCVDLTDGVLWVFRSFEILCKGRLTNSRSCIVESRVQCGQSIYMPGTEDLLELGFGIRRTFSSTFQFHSLLRVCTLVERQVPRSGDLGDVRKEKESRYGDW